MGILSALRCGSRDRVAEKMGLFSSAMDLRINAKVDAYEQSQGTGHPVVILAAISTVEQELLDEHYSGCGTNEQHVKWHAILEVMHTKRMGVIRADPSAIMSSESAEGVRRWIRNRYYELREQPDRSKPMMLDGFRMVDRAMLECMSNGDTSDPRRFAVWVREVARIGYESKVAFMEHRL